METTTTINKEVFLNYIKLGISVIPCNKYKRALVNWKDFQGRLPTVKDVDEWYSSFKDIDAIAMVTGSISKICIIDIDFPLFKEVVSNIYKESFISLKELVDTSSQKLVSNTPRGGSHFWFKTNGNCPENTVNFIPKIDFRGEGGYALIPPSYAWDSDKLKTKEYHSGKYTFSTKFDSLKDAINSLDYLPEKIQNLLSTGKSKLSTNCLQRLQVSTSHFMDGQRDIDLFKVAMSLADGKCSESLMRDTIKRLAMSCNFGEKEANIKVESAIKRYFKKHFNLSEDVKEFVLSTSGYFLSTDIYNCLQVSTREDKKNISVILTRLCSQGVIEKDGKQNGKWRKVDNEEIVMDLEQNIQPPVDIWLPCNLHNICKLRPKNIMIIAGVSNTGKTAWLLNIARNNKDVVYFNSEMEIGELKSKLDSFNGGYKQFKHIRFLDRSQNFADLIRPDGVNIIDFLEIHEEHYRIGKFIKDIHDKLRKGICIIAIQKDGRKDFGVGGSATLDKARIYINLDNSDGYQTAKIVKGKIWAQKNKNPYGAELHYWIKKEGTAIKPKSEWLINNTKAFASGNDYEKEYPND